MFDATFSLNDFTADAEMFAEKLAFDEEFMDKIWSVDVRLDGHFVETWSPPYSPLKPPMTFETMEDEKPSFVPWPTLDLSDDSMYKSALDLPEVDADDSDSILEVPDQDLDFSWCHDDDASKPDDSIIH